MITASEGLAPLVRRLGRQVLGGYYRDTAWEPKRLAPLGPPEACSWSCEPHDTGFRGGAASVQSRPLRTMELSITSSFRRQATSATLGSFPFAFKCS